MPADTEVRNEVPSTATVPPGTTFNFDASHLQEGQAGLWPPVWSRKPKARMIPSVASELT